MELDCLPQCSHLKKKKKTDIDIIVRKTSKQTRKKSKTALQTGFIQVAYIFNVQFTDLG